MSDDGKKGDILMERSGYVQWMKQEGLPVFEGHGMENLRELELAPWSRMGGQGAFVNLYGMEGVTGIYVAEIPPRGSLEPERHLYEEVICILDGHGATEVWQEGGHKQVFEWGPYSLFSPPVNSWHRLYNGGPDPVRFMAVTTAPLIIDLFHSLDFVFNCPFLFLDRYAAQEGFFSVGSKRYRHGLQNIWESNFIPDVKDMVIEDQELKGSGVKITQFELTGNSLIGHVSQWPVGRYHKAHFHGPGAVLLGLRSEGYVLLWSKDLGTRPYESGHADEVVEVKWKEGGIYSPKGGWFHQHFNVGAEPARQLAVRYNSRSHPLGFKLASYRRSDGVYIDIKKGGNMIEYQDEDPEIRRRYEAALKKMGVPCRMP